MFDSHHNSPAPAAASATGTAVLDIRDLRVSFQVKNGWREVVHGVSLTVGHGETVALVGESGSGKSVTSMSLLGLLPAATSRISGQAFLQGRDLIAMPEPELRGLRGDRAAMIFQEPMTSLNPVLRTGRQIAEVLVSHRGLSWDDARTETIRLMDRVRIPSAASRYDAYPQDFSGGMRQRAMIAMALACQPALLIADEPTTALDVTVQAQVLDLLRELQADTGMSILFITHDMGVVAEIADRTLVMRHGEVVESNDTMAVFADPQHVYTRELLMAVPRLGDLAEEHLPRRFPDRPGETPRPTVAQVDTNAAPVLMVRDLTTRFSVAGSLLGRTTGWVHAVEQAAFDLYPGETLALVGESGCGKSTTGLSLMNMQPTAKGQSLLLGEDLLKMRGARLRKQRRHIQMIYQDPFASLNPRIRIGKAIAEPFLEHGLGTAAEARMMTDDLLLRVGLTPDMANRFPHEFSGGQRQRICIARALSVSPKVIVADESVAALDVSTKAQVINLMMDLQEQLGISFIFISHDMAVVERVAHRVAVMYLGQIVEIGPRRAVFSTPAHPYTRRLLSAVPIPDPRLRGQRPPIAAEELKSPICVPGYKPPRQVFEVVGPDHLVLRPASADNA